MPETKLKCPSCEAVLKLTAPVAPGKAIKCPKCGAAIRVPATAGKASGPAAGVTRAAPYPQPMRRAQPEEEPDEEAEDFEDEEAPRPKKKTRRGVEEEDDFDELPRKRRKKSKKKQGNLALLWGLVGGGAGLVVIVLVVLFATGVLGGKKGDQPSGSKTEQEGSKAVNLPGQIVGKWELQERKAKVIFEFKVDGKVTITASIQGRAKVSTVTYKFIKEDKIDMRGEIEGQWGNTQATVTMKGDEMVWVRENG